MAYTPLPNPWKGFPLVGPLIDAIQNGLVAASFPVDLTIAAATRILANFTTSGDTQPAFRLFGDGKHEWGAGGSSAPDTNLYRSAPGVLALGTSGQKGRLGIFGSVVGDLVFSTLVTTDTNNRFQVQADGGIAWGPGNAATDTNLYRSAANLLKTDDGLVVSRGLVQAAVDLGSVGAGGTINIDASLGNFFKWTATASNYTLASPTNPTIGQVIILQTLNSGFGTFTGTIGTAYKFGSTGFVGSGGSGSYGLYQFVYDGSFWRCMLVQLNVAA